MLRCRHVAVAVLAAGAVAASAPAAAPPRAPRPVPRFTLATVDLRCFYARPSTPATTWPVRPLGSAPTIRGGFNDPRAGEAGPAGGHFGIDIEAPDKAPVVAVAPGLIRGVAEPTKLDAHFDLDGYEYWHVRLDPGIAAGTYVHAGQVIGHVVPGVKHVHLSEKAGGCGWVDPRRPAGSFRIPGNTELPAVGVVQAKVADAAALNPLSLLGQNDDPATPLALNDLHGKVDLRVQIGDTPVLGTVQWPQQTLMPAAVRSYLAPSYSNGLSLGPPLYTYDGSRLVRQPAYGRLMAFGTERSNDCYYPPAGRPCSTLLVMHVAGNGFDTTSVPNGRYQVCVEALTINDVAGIRCTPVTIAN